jgi:5-methylcytosine-specific restriction endonuclease McrA
VKRAANRAAQRLYEATEEGRAAKLRRRARRRARKLGALSEPYDLAALVAADGHRCAYCGDPADTTWPDHFVPISKGGDDTALNVVACCRSCNTSKNGRDPWEFIESINKNRAPIVARLVVTGQPRGGGLFD